MWLLNGIFFVMGLIGFGKLMMLYWVFEVFNNGINKIIMIEDLVEYEMESIG